LRIEAACKTQNLRREGAEAETQSSQQSFGTREDEYTTEKEEVAKQIGFAG